MDSSTQYNARVGNIFIEEYNNRKGTNYYLPKGYKDINKFPDIVFIDKKGSKLKVEITRILPDDFGEKTSIPRRLKKLFLKMGIRNCIIAIMHNENIKPTELYNHLKKDESFQKKIAGTYSKLPINHSVAFKIEDDIGKVTVIRQERGALEIIVLSRMGKLLDFAKEIKNSIEKKLSKYKKYNISEVILLLEGIGHPLLDSRDRPFYIHGIQKYLKENKELDRSNFFKEVWSVLLSDSEGFATERLI